MSAFVTLSGDRVCLRRWRDEDREAFASMNADARVMEFFRGRLSRAESDAMVDRIEKHFSERGFGLWAIEVPGVAAFIGFAGLEVPDSAPISRPAWKSAGAWPSRIGDRAMRRRRPRLALHYGFGTLALSEIVSFTSATNHRSRAVMERLGMRRDPADDFDYPAAGRSSAPKACPLPARFRFIFRQVLTRLPIASFRCDAMTCRLARHSELWQAVRAVDLWVHGLVGHLGDPLR